VSAGEWFAFLLGLKLGWGAATTFYGGLALFYWWRESK